MIIHTPSGDFEEVKLLYGNIITFEDWERDKDKTLTLLAHQASHAFANQILTEKLVQVDYERDMYKMQVRVYHTLDALRKLS